MANTIRVDILGVHFYPFTSKHFLTSLIESKYNMRLLNVESIAKLCAEDIGVANSINYAINHGMSIEKYQIDSMFHEVTKSGIFGKSMFVENLRKIDSLEEIVQIKYYSILLKSDLDHMCNNLDIFIRKFQVDYESQEELKNRLIYSRINWINENIDADYIVDFNDSRSIERVIDKIFSPK